MTRRTARFIRRYAATPSGARYRHPSRLFGAADVGCVYLPGDLTRYFQGGQIVATPSMYQDSAGTTPVTAVGQPVGLRLDVKSGAVRLGPERVSNGDFTSGATGWTTPTGWVIGSGVVTASSTSSSLKQSSVGPLIAGRTYLVTFDYTHVSGTLYVRVGVGPSTTFSSSGQKTAVLQAVSNEGIEFYGGAVSGVIDNISVREVIGTHQIQPSATSRPVLVASGGGYALQYDGVDDGSYSASTLDLTSTDKVTVLAAVRKLSDAARGMVLELAAGGVNGSTNIEAPFVSPLTNIGSNGRGTVSVGASYLAPSPVTAVVTVEQNISADMLQIRGNGLPQAANSSDQGTGNFGNHTLYIGRRNNSSLPFNGLEYGIVIIGRLLTERERKTVENFLARASGVTLP